MVQMKFIWSMPNTSDVIYSAATITAYFTLKLTETSIESTRVQIILKTYHKIYVRLHYEVVNNSRVNNPIMQIM